MKTSFLPPLLVLSLCCSLAQAAPAEHQEFEATLLAPFQSGAAQGRTFTLSFAYPGLARTDTVDWRLELVRPGGGVALRWRGAAPFTGETMTVSVPWSGRLGLKPAPGETLLNFGVSDSVDQTRRCWTMLPAIAAIASIKSGTPIAPITA